MKIDRRHFTHAEIPGFFSGKYDPVKPGWKKKSVVTKQKMTIRKKNQDVANLRAFLQTEIFSQVSEDFLRKTVIVEEEEQILGFVENRKWTLKP